MLILLPLWENHRCLLHNRVVQTDPNQVRRMSTNRGVPLVPPQLRTIFLMQHDVSCEKLGKTMFIKPTRRFVVSCLYCFL
ncbi:unnamed protein product [Brassica oleracea]